ncbi:MAG: hypothetical protein IGR92_17790 [Leptolyngbyaceae cyanobacterium T60_A2020_046]|nr:hypothetical protein [Leptolyngbyaceae cyanobacterium T60_A2020_046]
MNTMHNPGFAFVIPVVHPEDYKVKDYRCIEAVLKRTLESLNRQTYPAISVIVVGHRVPSWFAELGDRYTFLDVSDNPVFTARPSKEGARKHARQIDKGLKYTVGLLYALQHHDIRFAMPMDADDYVNVHLALYLQTYFQSARLEKLSGALIHKGLNVKLSITPDYEITYESAYKIRNFNEACGSCRIFTRTALENSLRLIDPDIEARFRYWSTPDESRSLKVSLEATQWLDQQTRDTYAERNSIINALGRHGWQEDFFRFFRLPFLGAAQGCGHNNHEGQRQGTVDYARIIKPYPLPKFYREFGLEAATFGPMDLLPYRMMGAIAQFTAWRDRM